MKKHLTVRTINALKPAAPGKRVDLWDANIPGFGLRVTDRGAISFVAMRRVGSTGQPIRIVVASHRCGVDVPEGLLSRARDDAREALRQLAAGVDPRAERKTAVERAEQAEAERSANAFDVVAEEFIKRHVLANVKGVPRLRSGEEVAAAIRREIVPAWKGKPIGDIRRRDVVKLIESVVDSGRSATAHHLQAYLSKLFNWAIARDAYGLEHSPVTRGMAKDVIGAKAVRQRVLTPAEIRDVWRAACELGEPFGPFIRLLLLSGQRRSEVAEARWPEFDLGAKIWTIPPSRAKNGAAHEVPLSAPALEIMLALRAAQDARTKAEASALPVRKKSPPAARLSPTAEPSNHALSTTNGRAPISGFSKVKDALDAKINAARAAAGEPRIDPWRLHDLRRTMRTNLSGLPVPDNVAELVIGHARPGLHKVYDQHSYRDEKRRALDLWADKLLSIVEPDRPSNVVALRAKA